MAELLRHRVYRRLGLPLGTEIPEPPSGENRWQVNASGASPTDEWLVSGPLQLLDYWRVEAPAIIGGTFDEANWQSNAVAASPKDAWQVTALGTTVDFWRASAP